VWVLVTWILQMILIREKDYYQSEEKDSIFNAAVCWAWPLILPIAGIVYVVVGLKYVALFPFLVRKYQWDKIKRHAESIRKMAED